MRPDCLAIQGFGKKTLDELLAFHDARLEGWAKYHVKDEYYPGIIDAGAALQVEKAIGSEKNLDKITTAVDGKLVYNLTTKNIEMLDDYEGDEYERKLLDVVDLSSNKTVKAWCYVWIDSIDRLVKYDGRNY